MSTKAILEKENAELRRHIVELERQLAEQALAEANAKLEKLFEVLPVGISVLDHQGRVVKQNPMLENILGLSAGDLAHGEYRKRQYIHPDGTPFSAAQFPSARVLYGATMVQDVEIGVIKEDDQTVWTQVSAAATPFSDWKAVIVTRDVTEQMQIKQALHESEGRFSFIFQGNPAVQLISRLDNGRIMDVNEACCRLLGLSREELIGHNAAELDFWADSAEKQQKIQSTRRAGGIGPFEVNVRQRSGEIRTVVVSSLPIVFGEVKAVITTAIDITEQKRDEQALRESEQRFSNIFNYSPIAMVVSRLSDGVISDANPAMQTLLGYSHAEMIGHSAAELQTWDNLQERQILVERLRTQKRVTNFETIARTKSGARANVLISAQVVVLNQEEFLLGEIVDITERKRAEQLLHEREHFISSILNLTPANIYVYDMETQSNVFSMDGITRMLGYSVEDIRVMGTELFSTLVHPDDLAGLNAFQTRIMALADGEIIENESRAKHRDGSWRVLHTYESPFLRNANGTLKQKIGVAVDVTGQKRAEEALRQAHDELEIRVQQRTAELTKANAALQSSQTTLQGFYDSAPFMMGVAALDGDKTVAISANQLMANFLARHIDDVLGRTGAELGNPADFEQMLVESYRRCQREGVPVQFEYEYPHGYGKRWLKASASFIGFGASGNPQFSFVIEDITEHKQAENAVRESEARFKAIYQHGPIGIALGDLEGRLTMTNPAFCAMLGYEDTELIHMNFRDLTVQDDLSTENELVEEILARKREHYEIEKRYIRKDGEIVWVTLSSAVLRDTQNKPEFGLAMVLDITERKRMEEMLRQMNEGLERHVAERTADLKQSHMQLQTLSRQLIETQEKERRSIGRELHDEIGQSLTGLRILLQMAQRLPLHEYEEKIKQAQQVAGELIDRISAISLDLRPPILDDLGLLPALLWFMDRYTSQTNVRVDFLHTGLQNKRFASVLETAVFRLVQEALTNVARHAGAVRVSVRVDAGDTFITISIEDEGRGFDIQSTFEQNDTSGLNGMRERVHLLMGDIDIDSAPGEGAHIFIRLPLDQKNTL